MAPLVDHRRGRGYLFFRQLLYDANFFDKSICTFCLDNKMDKMDKMDNKSLHPSRNFNRQNTGNPKTMEGGVTRRGAWRSVAEEHKGE